MGWLKALPLCFALSAAAQTPSLQAQIDSLKAGQAKLVAQVEELRALLQARQGPEPRKVTSVNVFGEPFNGDAKARVAILEYSDFQCPYCRRYATEVYPRLDEAYITKGKVKYFFRDLPLPDHPDAMFQARCARCAGEQGAFWEMHDRLFGGPMPADPVAWAKVLDDLKLNAVQFQQCMDSGKFEDAIRRSVHSAERLQLSGTPAFLVGTLDAEGKVLRVADVFYGGGSFETFRKALDDLLAASDR
jgi:protein-disulfide isomerase